MFLSYFLIVSVSRRLQLEAWSLWPVSIGHGPRFVDLYYFNVWGM